MLYDNKRWVLPQVKAKPIKRWQQVLLDAADLIERGGWTKGRLSFYGRHCVLGAINRASGSPKASQGYGWAQWWAKWKVRWHVGSSISSWNDRRAASGQSAVKMLRRVAGR